MEKILFSLRSTTFPVSNPGFETDTSLDMTCDTLICPTNITTIIDQYHLQY